MELDLDQLGVMHPKLQMSGEVELYRRRGALALARFGGEPGLRAAVIVSFLEPRILAATTEGAGVP